MYESNTGTGADIFGSVSCGDGLDACKLGWTLDDSPESPSVTVPANRFFLLYTTRNAAFDPSQSHTVLLDVKENMRFNFARALIWPTPETSIRSFSDELWIPADGPGMGYAGDWTESGIAPGHRESTSARDSFSFSFIGETRLL